MQELASPVAGADPPSVNEHRAARRSRVRFGAKLRDRSPVRFDIDIIDMSTTGFRAIVNQPLTPGGTVWVTLPGLSPIQAWVAWQRDKMVGCRFDRPLYPAVFDHVVAQHPA
jgi:hypothetical protein